MIASCDWNITDINCASINVQVILLSKKITIVNTASDFCLTSDYFPFIKFLTFCLKNGSVFSYTVNVVQYVVMPIQYFSGQCWN